MPLSTLLTRRRAPKTAHAPRLTYANSTADIQAEVVRCADDGERLRPIGGAHSLTTLTATDENRISLAHLRGADIAQLEARRLWVRAGTPLADVCAWLQRHELTLDLRPDYPGQTVGAAVALGSPGLLMARILALRIVHADGGVAVYTREEAPQTFEQMRVSLGTLGVITHVELRCMALSAERCFMRREADADEIRALLRAPRSETGLNSLTWFALAPSIVELRLRAGQATPPSLLDQARAAFMESIGNAALVQYAQRLPRGKRLGDRIGSHYARSTVRNVVPDTLTRPIQHIVYALPSASAGEVLDRVRVLWSALRFRCYAPVQLEFAPADPAWLSPTQGVDSVLLSFPYGPGTPHTMIEGLCLLLERHGGRPAWTGLPPHYLPKASHYPKLPEFAELRAEFDPHGVFLSPWLARLFRVRSR